MYREAVMCQVHANSFQDSNGSGIGDFTSVNPSCGNFWDFRAFLKEAHRRGIRVITELAMNHTSDQDPWFYCARRAALLDCVYAVAQPCKRGEDAPPEPLFHPAHKPTQEDIEYLGTQAVKRILRYLEKRAVVSFAAAPGDGEVNSVLGDGFGETNSAHPTSLRAERNGATPAGSATRSGADDF